MKKIFFILSLIVTHISNLYAVPAYPNQIAVSVDGYDMHINMKGDEYCKYAVDEQGYTILQNDSVWFYATETQSGEVVISPYELKPINKQNQQTINFLGKIKKGIVPKANVSDTEITHRVSSDTKSERKPAVGVRKVLIILMQFRDTKFTKTKEDFYRLFNEENYHDDGAMGSVYDYYNWASYGQLNLKSDVLGPYTASNPMSYYGGNTGVGGNDRDPYSLFWEAINYAIRDTDLSEYDSDGDGYVDNVHIVYAGYGEEAGATSSAIWAHEMTFRPITIQNMKIEKYSCAPELRGNKGSGISRIGPHCHEIGHALGAMDYYDTDYETGGNYVGTGKWDIMASGSWNNDGIAPADFNPYVKVYNFGWTEAKSLTQDSENIIGSSSEEGNIYRVNTGMSKDYFLLENRDNKGFHSAEPGKGLLIFHVGPQLETREATNTINTTYPQQCYVVCASSNSRRPSATAKSYGDINSAGCPYPGTSGNTFFSESSTPAAITVNGSSTGISISGIAFQGDNIVFQYGNTGDDEPDEPTPPPTDNVYLWGEDFEQLRLPSSWVYSDIKYEGSVEVVTKLSTNDSPSSPIAKSGKGYAKFVAKPQFVIGTYETVGILTSPRIKLIEDKSYILSFAVRKYNKEKSRDVISIILDKNNEDDDAELISKEITSQENWETYAVAIPALYTDFTLNLFMEIDYGSTLFVDNITISEKTETSIDKICKKSNSELSSAIYTLQGMQSQQYKPGINIVKMPDGSFRKVFVK